MPPQPPPSHCYACVCSRHLHGHSMPHSSNAGCSTPYQHGNGAAPIRDNQPIAGIPQLNGTQLRLLHLTQSTPEPHVHISTHVHSPHMSTSCNVPCNAATAHNQPVTCTQSTSHTINQSPATHLQVIGTCSIPIILCCSSALPAWKRSCPHPDVPAEDMT